MHIPSLPNADFAEPLLLLSLLIHLMLNLKFICGNYLSRSILLCFLSKCRIVMLKWTILTIIFFHMIFCDIFFHWIFPYLRVNFEKFKCFKCASIHLSLPASVHHCQWSKQLSSQKKTPRGVYFDYLESILKQTGSFFFIKQVTIATTTAKYIACDRALNEIAYPRR